MGEGGGGEGAKVGDELVLGFFVCPALPCPALPSLPV